MLSGVSPTTCAPLLLNIVHADDARVVADKPAGLLCVPGRGPERADCLAARGRGAAMQRALSIAFAERCVDKGYEAVVAGLPAEDSGEIDLPLAADWPNRPRQQVDRIAGKPSLTRWRVLQRDEDHDITRLALTPVTGRSHQLRVHLAAIGHAVLGDELYAPAVWAAASPRLLLHACRLALPALGDAPALHCTSPTPF